MDAVGVRGVRFFSAARWKYLPRISTDTARRVGEFGWHVQFYPDVGDVVEYERPLLDLGVPVVLDHLAAIPAAGGVDESALAAVLRMLDSGRVWVKLSGPMRCSPGDYPYADVTPIARKLAGHAPERMLWGSDWPHTNMVGRAMPDDGDLFDLLGEWVPDEGTRRRILVDNPMALYGFPPP